MTSVALATVGGASTSAAPRGAIELRGEDRLLSLSTPIRHVSTAMVVFAAASLAVHTMLMAAAVVAARQPLVVPPQQEISVEVVHDVPAPAPPKTPEPPKPAAQPKVPEQTKAPPPPKPPEPIKVPEAKKAESPNVEPAKAQPAKVQPAKAEQPKPADDSIEKLKNELAQLRAEQAALTSQSQSGAGKALALPTIGSDGDAVGYQQLVFSQLAKAKGDAEYHGQAGTTGVKFEMDEAGRLVRVEVVQSSGNAALDGRALDIIHRAAPFPPPPTAEDRIVFANVNFVPAKRP